MLKYPLFVLLKQKEHFCSFICFEFKIYIWSWIFFLW